MTSLSCVSPPAARLVFCLTSSGDRSVTLPRRDSPPATRTIERSLLNDVRMELFGTVFYASLRMVAVGGFEPNQGQQGLSLSLLPFSLSSTRPFSGCMLSWLSLHMALQLGSPSITRSSWSSWALNGNCYIPFGMSGAIIRPAMFLSPYDRRQTGQRTPRYFGPEMVAIKGFEPILSSF